MNRPDVIAIKWGVEMHTIAATRTDRRAVRQNYRRHLEHERKYPEYAPIGGWPQIRQVGHAFALATLLFHSLPDGRTLKYWMVS